MIIDAWKGESSILGAVAEKGTSICIQKTVFDWLGLKSILRWNYYSEAFYYINIIKIFKNTICEDTCGKLNWKKYPFLVSFTIFSKIPWSQMPFKVALIENQNNNEN